MKASEFALRLICASTLTCAAFLWFGENLMAQLLPSVRALVDLIDPEHGVLDLTIAHPGTDTVLRVEVVIRRMILTGSHVTYPDERARALVTTPLGAFWIAPSIAWVALLGWPADRWVEYPLRLLLSVPMLALLFALDVPFSLDGYIWNIHRDAHDPGGTMPLLVWHHFLTGGGRYLLGAAAALAIVTPAASLARQLARRGSG